MTVKTGVMDAIISGGPLQYRHGALEVVDPCCVQKCTRVVYVKILMLKMVSLITMLKMRSSWDPSGLLIVINLLLHL